MNTIITVSTIMSMYMSLVTDVENSKHCYNADIEDGKVVAMTVYDDMGKYLEADLKHVYTYDDESRLSCRETLKWNPQLKSWQKYSCLEYAYNGSGYTIEKRYWDVTAQSYAASKEYSSYVVVTDNVLAVNHYRQNNDTGMFEEADSILVYTPSDKVYLAMEE